MTDLALCRHPSPWPGGEPCPKEQDHEGEHVYWSQGTRKRGKNGVWIVKPDGTTLIHATFDGQATAEDVCALLALSDLFRQLEEQKTKLPPLTGGIKLPPEGEPS